METMNEQQPFLQHLNEEQLLSLSSSPDVTVESLLFPELSEVSNSDSSPPGLSSSPSYHPSSPSNGICEVTLYHKPRGSQGIWQPVMNGEGLRVTKGKGKRLKMKLKCEEPIDKAQLEVGLVDKTDVHPSATKDGFSVEQFFDVEDPRTVEMEIKLTKYCKKLQFWLIIRTPSGAHQVHSIEFGSHNNGKAAKPLESSQNMASINTVGAPIVMSSHSPTNGLSTSSLADFNTGINEKKRKDMNGEEQKINSVEGSLEVHGTVRAKAFVQFSDLRLKTNIEDIYDAIDIVSKLQGKTYYWKPGTVTNDTGGKRVIGLIAQEVQKVVPEVVTEDPETGMLAVSYAELVPVLIEAFKHHLAEYENNKKDIQNQIKALSEKVEGLQKTNLTYKPRMQTFLQYPTVPQHVVPVSLVPLSYTPPQSPMVPQYYPASQFQSVQAVVSPQVQPQPLPPHPQNQSQQPVMIPLQNIRPSPQYSQQDLILQKKGSSVPVFSAILIVIGLVLLIISFGTFGSHKDKGKNPPPTFIPLNLIGVLLIIIGLVILCMHRRNKKREKEESLSQTSVPIPPAGPLGAMRVALRSPIAV